jgi:3-methyladenine DNA glycosylase AlkD
VDIVAAVRQGLLESADPERAVQQRRYLRSQAEHWGVAVPQVRRAIRVAGRLGHDDLVAVVDRLWHSAVFDERLAAALLLDRHASLVTADDLLWLEVMVREAGTWALVDVLVPRPLSAANADEAAATTAVLDAWVADEDFWLRRAALLAHLVDLRAGAGDWARFTRYADTLLGDREFFVRKAMGWVLRETARRDPVGVRDWVARRTDQISGVALREAVKPLDPSDRDGLLAAYREGRRA